MRDDRERLIDMIEALERIERYAAKGRDAFREDELIQTWMIRHIEILGEASGEVSNEMKARFADVPWRQMRAMRNALIHGYFAINLERVWDTITDDLPPLKSQLAEVLDQIGDG